MDLQRNLKSIRCSPAFFTIFVENKVYTMKKRILLTCLIINYLLILIFIILIFSILLKLDFMLNLFDSTVFTLIRFILTIPVIVFWINNIIIWSKRDKSVGQFFLLFFLNGLYNPLYYRRILKHGWL